MKYFSITLFFMALLSLFIAPIAQIIVNGQLVYMNGEDEYSYLNYGFSEATFGITRISSIFVILGHRFGLNGSEINLILDTLSVIALCTLLFLMTRAQALKGCVDKAKAPDVPLALLLLLAIPLLMGTANPVHAKIASIIDRFDVSAYYIIFNHSMFPAILRSPESQLSLVATFGMLFACIKYEKGWLTLIAIPFTYYFVGLYFAAIVSAYYALFISKRYLGGSNPLKQALICLILFISLGLIVAIATHLFVSESHVVYSRAPVLGLSVIYMAILLGILCCVYDWRSLDEEYRLAVISIMVGAMMTYNLQIISGTILQPQHFEIDGPIAIAVLLGIFLLFAEPRNQKIARILTSVLISIILTGIMVYGYRSVDFNLRMFSQMKSLLESSEFMDAASTSPQTVFINDPIVSSQISGLVLNGSVPLLSSIEPAFLGNTYYHRRIAGLKRHLQAESEDEFRYFEQSLNYLIARYEDQFCNWQRFAVLRRGIVVCGQQDNATLSEGNFDEIVLFRVER